MDRGVTDMAHDIALSIVLPVRNEASCVGVVLREIIAVFEQSLPKPGEIIVIDDASRDASIKVVEAAVKDAASRRGLFDPSGGVKVSHFILPEQCGQSQALMKGLLAARGELIVSMDADGQYDPYDIPRFLGKMTALDMLCGVRKNRKDTIARILFSRVGNAFRNRITNDSIKDAGCTLRVMRKSCVPALAPYQGTLYGNEFFFHPLILRKRGFRVNETEVSHRPRLAGKSNYNLFRGRALRGLLACMKARRLFS
jgi:dolichol-phosphate mannosyltransferase